MGIGRAVVAMLRGCVAIGRGVVATLRTAGCAGGMMPVTGRAAVAIAAGRLAVVAVAVAPPITVTPGRDCGAGAVALAVMR
ncbi:MAG: hypothetical protein N4A39_16145 [Roseicyclus sp.]|nr:hypothetical protein [Roseicyclus sp.]